MADFVEFPGRVNKAQLLVPGQSIDLTFEPRAGEVRLSAVSTHPVVQHTGKPPSGDPDDDDFGPEIVVKGLPVQVRVNPPSGPTQTFDLEATDFGIENPLRELKLQVPKSQEKKTWKVTITNRAGERARTGASIKFVAKRHLLRTARVPVSLLNGAARELIKGLGLEVVLDGGDSFIDFSEDLKRHAGGALRRQEFSVPGLSDINLRTINAQAVTEPNGTARKVFFDVFARFEESGREIDVGPVEGDVENLAVRTRFEIFFLGGKLRYRPTVELGLLINGNIYFDVLAAGFEFLTKVREFFGGGDAIDLDEINEILAEAFESALTERDVSRSVTDFLTAGIMELAERGNTLHRFLADERYLQVTHFDPTREEQPRILVDRIDDDIIVTSEIATDAEIDITTAPVLTASTSGGSGGFARRGFDPTKALPGILPGDDIDLPARQSDVEEATLLQDRIDHIVVLMMENRSFDHLFGHISLPTDMGGLGRGDYDGLSGDESNLASSTGPRVGIAREANDRTRFPFSPDHGFDGVAMQMNDGKMDGFVRSFANRFRLEDITKANPMGYYGRGALPAFDFLIDHFTVCDSWYCSHPGPTWPNRFCAVAGQTPEVTNLSVTDPRLGYVQLATVFDKLSRSEWVNYESDVSFLRMFRRYRLDDRNIRPVAEFFDRARRGQLPMFTFIDPDYTDVIPIDRVANDDHPPANLRNGQLFIERIYNALRSSPTWEKTMFVITYDEHGGFFDHKAPPGTAANPDDSIALVHPDGRPFLGPRVPSIVISPWAPRGANSTRLEHTSIIKTVLLRKFGATHPFMGGRVHQSNSLAATLTSPVARSIPPMPAIVPPPKDLGVDIGPKPSFDDFHEGMRRYSVPR